MLLYTLMTVILQYMTSRLHYMRDVHVCPERPQREVFNKGSYGIVFDVMVSVVLAGGGDFYVEEDTRT